MDAPQWYADDRPGGQSHDRIAALRRLPARRRAPKWRIISPCAILSRQNQSRKEDTTDLTAASPAERSARRSLLFVPGARPDRFDKAAASDADIMCIDLEDAVAPGDKSTARQAALEWLGKTSRATGKEVAVRLNGVKTLTGLDDLAAFARSGITGGLVMLPKVDSADEIRWVDALLTEAGSQSRLIALIESVDGLENVQAIAGSTPRLELLLFGAVDLSAELGTEVAHEPLLYARCRCVHAARRAGIGILDVPLLDFRNLELLAEETATAKALGFTGKAALHPTNIETIHDVFTPSAAEIQKAREIVTLFEESPTGLVVHNGKLIEAPVIRTMRGILDIAEQMGRT